MAIKNIDTFNEEFDSIVRVSENYVSLQYNYNHLSDPPQLYQLAYSPYNGYNPHTTPLDQIQPKQTYAVEIIMTEGNYNRLVKFVGESVTERKIRESDPRLMELYMAYKTMLELLK
jgi:hypothetical protein